MAAGDINGSYFIYCIICMQCQNQKSQFSNDNTEAKIYWKTYAFHASIPISFVCTIYNSVCIIFFYHAHTLSK